MAEHSFTPSSGTPSSGTSPSLLARVRAEEPSAWDRLVTLYAPLVFHWCRRAQLQEHDVEDVFQEVFHSVLIHVGRFRKEQPGHTFRGWLSTITRNKIRDHFRRAGREPRGEGGTEALLRFSRLPAPERDGSGLAGEAAGPVNEPEAAADARAERGLFGRALGLIRDEFRERTWKAFLLTAVEGRSAADAAAELGMSPGSVRVARSRVLRRLREEMGDVS